MSQTNKIKPARFEKKVIQKSTCFSYFPNLLFKFKMLDKL